ncbi:glycosyltransferase [Flavobacterium rhizosphaerae]|uniref:Glycosyltransferase n=1 Tax=Flavobacterium rhizosphaerae TaxID=3163298 RepID=A0ABW8Z031_9FLAO
MPNIIFYVFIGITVLQLAYYFIVFGKFIFAKQQQAKPVNFPVSVMVLVKNNFEKVEKLVPQLTSQNYPDFEVVLVDNASDYETVDQLEQIEKQYANVRLVKVENNEAFWGHKKYAFTLGIKAAKKDYLLFIDADCQPASDQWIAHMAAQFTKQKTIIIGFSAYRLVKNSLLNKLIRFDEVVNTIQLFGWTKLGAPYTGNGRNLAYKKDEFFKHNGYINHMNIRTGEDALFVNEAANATNTAVCYTPESFTYGNAPSKLSEWVTNKRKAAYTMSFFKTTDKCKIKLFIWLQVLFFIFVAVLLIMQFNWMMVVPVIAFRYMACWLIMAQGAAKLNEKDTIYWFPFIEIMLIFTQLYLVAVNLLSRKVHWK